MTLRDFDANPYTADEVRVARYVDDFSGIGSGDDPIEFLIASHNALKNEINRLKLLAKHDEQYIREGVDALKEIWAIVHTPTRDTKHKNANDHYGADFDKIRAIIKGVLDDQI
jgi:hypothetical protein